MKRFPLAVALAIACSIGTAAASAQDRGPAQKQYRGGARADWHGDHRYGGAYSAHAPRYYYGYAPSYRPYRYYDPYWLVAAPAFAYPYPVYAGAPVVVGRVYEPPREYVEERPAPYPQRPRAEIPPGKPAPKVAAIPVPRMERYTLSAKELFEFDEAVLHRAQPKLDEIAAAMRADPGIGVITITGHTDRLGSDAYNLALSQRRAEAVKGYLVERGVAGSRLTAVGRGESQPVVQCDNANRPELIKCLEPNRRVEVEEITIERSIAPGS